MREYKFCRENQDNIAIILRIYKNKTNYINRIECIRMYGELCENYNVDQKKQTRNARKITI